MSTRRNIYNTSQEQEAPVTIGAIITQWRKIVTAMQIIQTAEFPDTPGPRTRSEIEKKLIMVEKSP